MDEAKEIWKAEDAAAEIGISYQRLVRLIRAGKASAKKNGLAITNPWQLHVSEVKRLKAIYSPPTAATCSPSAAG